MDVVFRCVGNCVGNVRSVFFGPAELEEEHFRLTHRSWWRDLFDVKDGSWCLTHTYFGEVVFVLVFVCVFF